LSTSADTILVTGATGFVGGALLQGLLARGVSQERLRCLVRDSSAAVRLGIPRRLLCVGDVTRPDSLAVAATGVRTVIHAAGAVTASRRRGYRRVNTEGTRNLLSAVLAGSPGCRFVFVSSLAAAGPSVDGSAVHLPASECRPVSVYGETKRQAELAVIESGLPHWIVRPPVVYGPGDAATRLLFKLACGRRCAVPLRTRPLSVIHVSDVTTALCAALAAEPQNAVLPLDGPQRTDTHGLMLAIAAACGRRAKLLRLPLPVVAAAATVCDVFAMMTGRSWLFSGDKVKEWRAEGWVADAAETRRRLGWRPQVELEEGLRQVAGSEGFDNRAVDDATRAR